MNYILETCADSVQSAIEAKKGGANRIELCSNLVIGGTSPGESLFRQVKEQTGLNVRVLLRPRFGDFCYDNYEFRMILDEVRMFRKLGADGIVIRNFESGRNFEYGADEGSCGRSGGHGNYAAPCL